MDKRAAKSPTEYAAQCKGWSGWSLKAKTGSGGQKEQRFGYENSLLGFTAVKNERELAGICSAVEEFFPLNIAVRS